jgi:hypothetical protein
MIHGFMTFSRITAGALVFVCAGAVAMAQKPSKTDPKADPAAAGPQQEYSTVVRLADTAMAGQPTPNDFQIQFQNDFLRAQGGRVWVPMTLTIDPQKLPTSAVTMYVRVAPRGMTAPPLPPPADKNEKKKDKKNDKPAATPPPASNYPYEDIALLEAKPGGPAQPIRIVRGLGVMPGSYDLYVVLHERTPAPGAGAKASVLKQPLDVPNYSNGEFATSSVIIADNVEQLPTALPQDQQSEHPYTFGQTEIVVSPDHKFRKSQELYVLLQIYNPSLSADKKFNLEATYTFYRQDQAGERRFNSTEPQLLTPESMGGQYDPTGAAAIQAGQAIALQTFPEGNYRLEIKITDKLNAKALTQNVNFTVAP